MIQVQSFKAKVVREPEVKEMRKGGELCKTRVRQVDPGKASVFIDLIAFDEAPVEVLRDLAKGDEIEVTSAGLVYEQWEGKPKRKGGKPPKHSKHSLVVEEVQVA